MLGGEPPSVHRARVRMLEERSRRAAGVLSRVGAPVSVLRVVDAGYGLLLACHRNEKALSLVGFGPDRMADFKETVRALHSAHVLWRLELERGTLDEGWQNVELAREARDRIYGIAIREALSVVGAARDAFRHEPRGGKVAVFDAWLERMM